MKASVVVPVYNKAPWLRECLDSLLAQTFADFELIAVDDASTDESPAILRSYTDPRMRVITMERNAGPGMAAQRGMDEARGTYILRVDADDTQLPERFARQVRLLDEHPGIGACGTALRLLGDPDTVRRKPLRDAECRAELPFGVALYQPTSAYRRSVLLEHDIRYLPEWPRYGEDWMLQARLARVTRFANLPEPLVGYREGPQGISFGRDRAEELGPLFRDVFATLGLPDPTPEELELHHWCVKVFLRPPDARMVRAFKAWLHHLAGWNAASGVFDRRVFQRRLDRAWEELFHHLPAYGAAPVWAYLKAGGAITPARLYYLLRSFIGPRPSIPPTAA